MNSGPESVRVRWDWFVIDEPTPGEEGASCSRV